MSSKELVFFGRIAASFTHELKNVLAIVKETSGLMEDLLEVTPEGVFPHRERFKRAVTTIQAQVARGVDLSSRMNRFAHAPDHAVASVELNDTLQQVALLAERLARIKGVSFQVNPLPDPVNLVTSPVGIQLVLFKAMECCWLALESGSTVEVSAISDAGPSVTFACPGGLGEQGVLWDRVVRSDLWGDLERTAEEIEATIQGGADGTTFAIAFPVASSKE